MSNLAKFPVTEKESLHGVALSNYLLTGDLVSFAEVHWYLDRGIDCPVSLCQSNAARQFIARRWPDERMEATNLLFERYIDTGIIRVGMQMAFAEGSVEEEHHGQSLVEFALWKGNVEALLALIRKGAIESTDFSVVDARYRKPPFAGKPGAAFDDLLREHWSDRPHRIAAVTELVIRRRFEAGAAAPLASLALPAAPPRRARAV